MRLIFAALAIAGFAPAAMAARLHTVKPVHPHEQHAAAPKECRHKVVKTVTAKFIELRRRERCF